LIPQFAAHPPLAIDLGLNDRRVDLIEEGWDLVIRIGNMEDSTMVARRLAPCRTVVCAAPVYLEKRGAPRTIADLARHNCLAYTLSRTIGAERWSFGRDGAIRAPVSGDLSANNGDALVAAAVAGQGIIYQPTFLVSPEIEAGRLVPLQLDHEPIELDGVFAGYPSDRRPPAKVRAFIDFLLQRFGPTPPWDRASARRAKPGRRKAA
jgi:DNA-binding transcriptional LysR family regulator